MLYDILLIAFATLFFGALLYLSYIIEKSDQAIDERDARKAAKKARKKEKKRLKKLALAAGDQAQISSQS